MEYPLTNGPSKNMYQPHYQPPYVSYLQTNFPLLTQHHYEFIPTPSTKQTHPYHQSSTAPY